MFRRQDQEKLLKYLSKSNNSTPINKNVIKNSSPIDVNSKKSSTPMSTVKTIKTAKTRRQHVDNDIQKKANDEKWDNQTKRKIDSSLDLNQNNSKKVKFNKQKDDSTKPKQNPKTPPKVNEKKIKNQDNKKKNKKLDKKKFIDKPEVVPEPISEKKTAKIKKQNDDDEKLILEVKKMYDLFKQEAENGTETVDDIENDILENEGFVEDDNDGVGLKSEEDIRSNDVGSKAKQQLAISMFRSMNEYLYTHSSGESKKEFTANKFKLYHQAYDKLMDDWPVKPVDFLIDTLKNKISERKLSSATIADIGCGSRPQIAEAFPTSTVYSYDLYQNDITDSRIISADMCRLPLDSEVCDYAVYSLSLMPTNLREAIKESNRILKNDGHLLIVEVSSRFADFQGQGRIQNVPEKYVGQRFAKELKSFGFKLVHNEELQPNGYFVYFCFKKISSVENIHKNQLPELMLKPCIYKPR